MCFFLQFAVCRLKLFVLLSHEFTFGKKITWVHIATAGMNEDKLLIFFNNDILTTFNVTFTDRAWKGGEFIKHFTDYKAFRHAIIITVEMRHFDGDNYCFLLK